MLERVRQLPALQRGGLVERARLHLEQRQIVQRIGDEHTGAVAAGMPGDLLAAAQDHDLVDEALHHDVLEAVGGRHRIVVAAIAHERHRRDPRSALLARF